MANLRRDPFDRDRKFIVVRSFSLHGEQLGPGDPFNPDLVSGRRLRQMYESRLIAMNGPPLPRPTPTAPPAPAERVRVERTGRVRIER